MRLGWVVLVSCARPASAPVLEAKPRETIAPLFESCDVAAWHERASTPLRARIRGREIAVIGQHGEHMRVIAQVVYRLPQR